MKRKISLKYTYFDDINTEYKAYILGLIYADGTIRDKVKGKREWRLQISIQEEDGKILQKLLNDTNQNNLIIRNPPSTIKNGWKKQLVACVNNTYLCKSLINLGCYPRKSSQGMRFPDIDKKYISHFIRGFFDGDGCINIQSKIYHGKKVTSKYFRKRIAFISTDKDFLDKLMSYLPITKIYKREKLRTQIVYTYWIERKQDVINVREYLYKDSKYYFKRKYNKFYMPISSQAVDTSTEGSETT